MPDPSTSSSSQFIPGPKPSSFISWNRLESRTRDNDYRRSLRAEIRDPLWMLTRQWQVGEFLSENRASPAFAYVKLQTEKLLAYQAADFPEEPYEKGLESFPLEMLAERDSSVSGAVAAVEQVPLVLRVQLGKTWLDLLRKFGYISYSQVFINTFPVSAPDPSNEVEWGKHQSNTDVFQMQQSLYTRMLDGYALLQEIKANPNFPSNLITQSNTPVQVGTVAFSQLSGHFVNWFKRAYPEPEQGQSAWVPEQLEHRFKVSGYSREENGTAKSYPKVQLEAEGYYSGELDWYSFDAALRELNPVSDWTNTDTDASEAEAIQTKESVFIPNELRFKGMPNSRWWTFEEGNLDYNLFTVQPTDMARLLFLEFQLIYNNDWFIIPHSMPVGSMSLIKKLIVTDVMGMQHEIYPTGENIYTSNSPWSMYTLTPKGRPKEPDDLRLFVPPTVVRSQNGEVVEKVNFVRDEMANMVWAVEQIIPDGLGGGTDGYQASNRLKSYLNSFANPTIAPVHVNQAKHRYQIMTSTPENWIPFVPKAMANPVTRTVLLERSSMPREINGLPRSVIQPRTDLVGSPQAPYLLHQEEVPRSGVVVQSNYQRARWYSGKTYVWKSRKKTMGRGDANSGLVFDQLFSKEVEEDEN